MKNQFELRFDESAGIIRASLWGALKPDVVSLFFNAMGGMVQQHNCHLVLSDLRRAHIAAEPSEIFFMVETLEARQVTKGLRRAIVVSRDQKDYQFWKQACSNQGFTDVELFHEVALAKDWLINGYVA